MITLETIKNSIRNIPDFPLPGIQFKDITTVIMNPDQLSYLVDTFCEHYKNKGITKVVCIESRGFILGGAIAARLGAGFIPVRKPGKLPSDIHKVTYDLEYGTDSIEIHTDAIESNDVILLHDDLLATGGTAGATIDLLSKFGVNKVYSSFIIELDFLKGREKLGDNDIFSLIHF